MMREISRRRARSLCAAMFVSAVFVARTAEALIINVDATADEVAAPVLVSLAAGTYSVTPIGIAGGGAYDAWNPWGDTNCTNPSGCEQTFPTTNIGWKVSYDVVSEALTAVSVSGSPLAPVGAEQAGDYWLVSGSETDRYHVDNQTVYPTASDAFAFAESSEFTVSTSGLVGFAIHDSDLGDNLGGMSFEVLAVPEPSTISLVGLALVSCGFWRQLKRTRAVHVPRSR